MKTVLIDGDQMVYACGFASEGEPLANTLHLVKRAITQIIEDTGADEYPLYISGKGNFREDIALAKGYKATRSGRKPETYEDIRNYLVEHWGAIKCDGYEADDAVSIMLWEDYMASSGDKELSSVIVSSPDKDLNNTPGWHYNPRTRETKWITEEQATRHFYYQLLAGDRVDNITGLPYCPAEIQRVYGLHSASGKGCGEGSAKKIMATIPKSEHPEKTVWSCYAIWGGVEGMSVEDIYAYFVEQGQLLWMIREYDDFGGFQMWEPVHTLEELLNGHDNDSTSPVNSGEHRSNATDTEDDAVNENSEGSA